MSVIRWEDPPEHRNKGVPRPNWPAVDQTPKWQAIADELRANPGRWGVIGDRLGPGTAGPITRRIRRGDRPMWSPAGSFEAVSRKRSDGEGIDMYARYVGEAGSEATPKGSSNG